MYIYIYFYIVLLLLVVVVVCRLVWFVAVAYLSRNKQKVSRYHITDSSVHELLQRDLRL